MMTVAAQDHPELSPAGEMRTARRRGLFSKYAATIVGLVVFVLMVNGAIEAYIIYRETTTQLADAQVQAIASLAARCNAALLDLEREASFVTRASSTTIRNHRSDYLLLLQRTSAISDVTFVDGGGHPQLKVGRGRITVGGDISTAIEPSITEGRGRSSWFSPPSVQNGRPLLVLTMAHAGDGAGATVVRIDLSKLFGFIRTTPIPSGNYVYVTDAQGSVLVTSRDSPVAPGAALSGLPAIKDFLQGNAEPNAFGSDLGGRSVIRAASRIEAIGSAAFIEEPTSDALRPLRDFALRSAWLLAFGLGLAILAGLTLSRRMITPIRALHEGASRLAANDFDHRIEVRTGDELEELAAQFNRMAADLRGSYGRLESEVEARTRDLALTVRELKTLEEIGRALASSLDGGSVVATIVSKAIEFTDAHAGAFYAFDAGARVFHVAEAQGFPLDLKTATANVPAPASGFLEAALESPGPVRVPRLAEVADFPSRDLIIAAGFRSVLAMGLGGSGRAGGALVMYSRDVDAFPEAASEGMQTFAFQSVLALHNAQLFQELVDRGHQLEVANAHRTQFFANMSHELRTPLNAVLGYSELLYDGLYGELPERAVGVMDRIQANSKHLLGLINDVLDMTKMEAGALVLSLNDYSVKGLIDGVVATTESLARTKGLAFGATVPDGLPVGHGDDRRLTQVLLNLVGNAIKFTDEGAVTIEAKVADGCFRISVRDTGPGISPDEQKRIFDEFQQVDDASTRKKGGTGLGLSISRRLLAMHGGQIEVASAPGEGAVFTLVVPVRVEEQRPVE